MPPSCTNGGQGDGAIGAGAVDAGADLRLGVCRATAFLFVRTFALGLARRAAADFFKVLLDSARCLAADFLSDLLAFFRVADFTFDFVAIAMPSVLMARTHATPQDRKLQRNTNRILWYPGLPADLKNIRRRFRRVIDGQFV